MILEFPILNEKQEKEVAIIREMEGWNIISESMSISIELNESQLSNWKFKKDENNEIQKKDIAKFEQIQLKNILLKEFLRFVNDSETIEHVKSDGKVNDHEVYDVPVYPDNDV